MPRGTEREPGPYALEVAAALAVIAGKLRLSNRALAAQMDVGEKYIRDRIKKTAAVSFTVSDVERFSMVAELEPAVFLNDPAGEAASYPDSVSVDGAIVTNIGKKAPRPRLADVAANAEGPRVVSPPGVKKAALRNPEMNRDEDD